MPKGQRMTSEEKIAQLELQIKMEKAKASRTDDQKFALDCAKKIEKGIQDNVFTEEEVNEVQTFINMVKKRVLN